MIYYHISTIIISTNDLTNQIVLAKKKPTNKQTRLSFIWWELGIRETMWWSCSDTSKVENIFHCFLRILILFKCDFKIDLDQLGHPRWAINWQLSLKVGGLVPSCCPLHVLCRPSFHFISGYSCLWSFQLELVLWYKQCFLEYNARFITYLLWSLGFQSCHVSSFYFFIKDVHLVWSLFM